MSSVKDLLEEFPDAFLALPTRLIGLLGEFSLCSSFGYIPTHLPRSVDSPDSADPASYEASADY
jgi:hypothetical protein